jgi:ABC-type nitrate/sulfonate/bicarbonate transport system ATPase subunit
MHAKKTAFIVEHDFIMATYLADRVIVYKGEPSVHATATTPQSLQVRAGLWDVGCRLVQVRSGPAAFSACGRARPEARPPR